jgi:hypothetical protein
MATATAHSVPEEQGCIARKSVNNQKSRRCRP